jgi:hypothetical protein
MADSRPGRQRLPLHPGQTFFCSVLFFLPALIPPLFGWLNGFLAVPVIYLLCSRGAAAGSMQLQISLLAAGLAALFTGRIEGFLFSLTLVPLGYSLHRSALAGVSPAVSGGRGGLVLLGTWLLFWTVQGMVSGVNPYTQLRESLDTGFRQMLEFAASEEAALTPEMLYGVQQALGEIRATAPRLLPGLLAALVPVTVWLNMGPVRHLDPARTPGLGAHRRGRGAAGRRRYGPGRQRVGAAGHRDPVLFPGSGGVRRPARALADADLPAGAALPGVHPAELRHAHAGRPGFERRLVQFPTPAGQDTTLTRSAPQRHDRPRQRRKTTLRINP